MILKRAGGFGLGCMLVAGVAVAQSVPEYELPPIEYSKTAASNRVTEIEHRLAALETGSDRELLLKALGWLDIPVESQVLVFSKTSLQGKLISPEHPRAIFFSDDSYFGWVPGGLMEATVTDPKLGLVFYQLDPRAKRGGLRFERDNACLSCHAGSQTRNWPGLIVRSVYADRRGHPILSAGTFLTGQESPLSERWGGWYVTGKHGSERHMGNVTAGDQPSDPVLDRERGANVTDLSPFFDVKAYPRSDSDIVALMVLEHQIGMHNRLCTAGLRARKWLEYQRSLQQALGEPISAEPTGTALVVIRSEAQKVVEHLLFSEEAELPSGGISGRGEFEKVFLKNKKCDTKNRSLKDFDLKNRLFRYPCSYMIYSEAFEHLPDLLKAEIGRQLSRVLAASTPEKKFEHLTSEDRQAIREILMATKPELLRFLEP